MNAHVTKYSEHMKKRLANYQNECRKRALNMAVKKLKMITEVYLK